MSAAEWMPSRAITVYGRPQLGDLVAYQHAVWRVIDIRLPQTVDPGLYEVPEIMLTAEDVRRWEAAGCPPFEDWAQCPYRVVFDFVAGVRPSWASPDGPVLRCSADRDTMSDFGTWQVYRGGRWPQCSCCGEPVPCRAELNDRDADEAAATMERMSKRVPGVCWACAETITTRQETVRYPGENVEYLIGPEPVFHIGRRKCLFMAQRYEEKWIAVDPGRERILTWPACRGLLIVHGDGSSECVSDTQHPGTQGCGGHLDSDHGGLSACYAAASKASCGGCAVDNHPGIRTSPARPLRRDRTQETAW